MCWRAHCSSRCSSRTDTRSALADTSIGSIPADRLDLGLRQDAYRAVDFGDGLGISIGALPTAAPAAPYFIMREMVVVAEKSRTSVSLLHRTQASRRR